ncbi:MAG: hypothetical protein IJT18_00070, partial [Oscillospiraceae bacterium]|nr:hypothetical protein [Oscillospiraceae bacterium]
PAPHFKWVRAKPVRNAHSAIHDRRSIHAVRQFTRRQAQFISEFVNDKIRFAEKNRRGYVFCTYPRR